MFELAQRMQQVTLIPDQGAVEELTATGLYPAQPEKSSLQVKRCSGIR
jgi:hypothetical protein